MLGADDFVIDAEGRRLLRGEHDVVLEPRILAVILELTARPGVLVTRNQLLDAVWGHRHLTRSALNRVIACARRALGDDAESPRYIATVHGAGYRYIGPVPRRSAISQGRVWYLDLAVIEQRAERLCALAALFGMAGTGTTLPQHILIRLQRPSPQGEERAGADGPESLSSSTAACCR